MVPLLLFGALAVLFMARLFAGDPSRVPSALIGHTAPVQALPAVEGLMAGGKPVPGFTLVEHRGKVVILNVFGSWCPPCREEHPLLIEMARAPGVTSGKIVMAGLNYKDDPENARRFLGALGNPFAVVGADRTGRAAIEWGVYGAPETFVVGPDGTIRFKHIGPLTAQSAADLMTRAQAALASP
jgi:cytochrome c biogenesis protein CcmG, thiol:disulfide interchange protein DsbE